MGWRVGEFKVKRFFEPPKKADGRWHEENDASRAAPLLSLAERQKNHTKPYTVYYHHLMTNRAIQGEIG
jgi:hypothetical protein